MSSTWEEFVTNVKEDGRSRSYMFEWSTPPLFLTLADADLKLMSASLPGGEIEELTTYWQGSAYKCGGSRRFNDWTVTIMSDNTTAKNLRIRFELWMAMINFVGLPESSLIGSITGLDLDAFHYGNPNMGLSNAIASLSLSSFGGYYSPQILSMLDDRGEGTISVLLSDSWPKSVGDISLSRDSSDFAQFDVTFAYNNAIVAPSLDSLGI
jgi:hypothetical protein